MVAGPWCRPLGFSVGPVTPTVFNPSELTNGAYIVLSIEDSDPAWLKLGAIAVLSGVGDTVTMNFVANDGGVPYAWDGSGYVLNELGDPEEIFATCHDIFSQVYAADYGEIQQNVVVGATLPSELIAIVYLPHL